MATCKCEDGDVLERHRSLTDAAHGLDGALGGNCGHCVGICGNEDTVGWENGMEVGNVVCEELGDGYPVSRDIANGFSWEKLISCIQLSSFLTSMP